MKTLGMIGGVSWESTAHYYTRINQLVAQRLGGLHSARLLMYSVEFDEVQKLQHADDWKNCGRIFTDIARRLEQAGDVRENTPAVLPVVRMLQLIFTDIARRLEQAGADGLIICANTMHILAE